MRQLHFSIKGMLGAIALFAIGLTCLLNASSPWAGVAFSSLLSVLTVALIGVAYRRGDRRAFWLGLAICGWFYFMLSSGPWFADYIGPGLVTTKVLKLAYPLAIPDEFRAENALPRSSFVISSPEHGDDIEIGTLNRYSLDVLVPKAGKDQPTLLVQDVRAEASNGSGSYIQQLTISADSAQLAKLAMAGNAKFVIQRHFVSRFAGLWSNPPVQEGDFVRVGHAFWGLLCALAGGVVGRYFYASRDSPA
jgi:hypothetical protein